MEKNVKSYGLSSWDESTSTSAGNFKTDFPKFEYMRLKDGNNSVRIVTAPYRYFMVRYKAAGDKGFGKRVNTAWPLHDDCPTKNAGLKPKERYLVGVIDREDQKLKVLDMSILVYEQVQGLKNDIEWGTPSGYDINIRKNSKAKAPAGFYNVLPRSKAPLSQADEALLTETKENLEKYLVLRTTPPKPEFVRKRLEELGWDGKSQLAVQASTEDDSELVEVDDTAYEFKRPAQTAQA